MLRNKKIDGSDSPGEDGAETEGNDSPGVSIERILAAGLSRGLTMRDADRLTLGMWVDYIIEYNNMHKPTNETTVDRRTGETVTVKKRKATQADFDAF